MTSRPPDSVIAVFERQPYWGPELQRQFVSCTVSIRECRKVDDLLAAISGCRSALCVIDLNADLIGSLKWLPGVKQDLPEGCSIIACGGPDDTDLEWILREAGVSVFLSSVIPGDRFAWLCRKQLGLICKMR